MGIRAILKLLIFLLMAGLIGIGTLLFFALKGMKDENNELLQTEQKLSEQIQKLTKERDYKREYFQRLLYDEDFAGRVIRQKLGFVNKGEIVFRFEGSDPVGIEELSGVTPAGGKTSFSKTLRFPELSENLRGANDGRSEKGGNSSSDSAPSRGERTLIDRLMFWRADAGNAPAAENISASPAGTMLAQYGSENEKREPAQENAANNQPPLNATSNTSLQEGLPATYSNKNYNLEEVKSPVKDRVKFITGKSTQAKAHPKTAPKQIVFFGK